MRYLLAVFCLLASLSIVCPVHAAPAALSRSDEVAAKQGDMEVLGARIASGTHLEARNARGDTLLHIAVFYGRERAAQLLVEKGASPLAKNSLGWTPLDIAAVKGHLGLGIRLALHCPHMPPKERGIWLAYALAEGDADSVAAFLAQPDAAAVVEASPEAVGVAIRNHDVSSLRALLQGGVAQPQEALDSMLRVAALNGKPDDIDFLVAQGANSAQGDELGRTALHFAASEGVAARLLAAKAPVDAKADNGLTPLHMAVITGNVPVASLLLAHGAKARVNDAAGLDPLDYVTSDHLAEFVPFARDTHTFKGAELAFKATRDKRDFQAMERRAKTKKEKALLEAYALSLLKNKGRMYDLSLSLTACGERDSSSSGIFVTDRQRKLFSYRANVRAVRAAKQPFRLHYGPYALEVETTLQYKERCARQSGVLGNDDKVNDKSLSATSMIKLPNGQARGTAAADFEIVGAYVDRGLMGGSTQCILVSDPKARAKVVDLYPVDKAIRDRVKAEVVTGAKPPAGVLDLSAGMQPQAVAECDGGGVMHVAYTFDYQDLGLDSGPLGLKAEAYDIRTAPGARGMAARFTGDDDEFLAVSDSPLFHATSYTVQVRVKAKQFHRKGEPQVVLAKGRDIGDESFCLQDNGRSFSYCYSYGHYFRLDIPLGALDTGAWNDIVYVVDDATKRISAYVNGKLAADKSFKKSLSLNSTYPLVIGRHFTSSNGGGGYPYPCRALVDEVRFYNAAVLPDGVQGR